MTIESLPPEILHIILEYSATYEQNLVCKRWNTCKEKIIPGIFRQICDFVASHPHAGQIRQLVGHVTSLEMKELKRENLTSALLKTLFCALEQLLDTPRIEDTSFGVARFQRLIMRIELQGLTYLCESVAKWFSHCDIPQGLPMEKELAKRREWLETRPVKTSLNITLNFTKKKVFLLSPELLNRFPIISIDLQGAGLSRVPCYVPEVKALRYLYLSGNPIDVLTADFWKLTSLNVVDVSNTRLSEENKALIKTKNPSVIVKR